MGEIKVHLLNISRVEFTMPLNVTCQFNDGSKRGLSVLSNVNVLSDVKRLRNVYLKI